MSLLRCGLIAVLILLPVAAASAQVLERPPRTTRGLFGGHRPVDPNRSYQELTLTLDVLGGYDDVVVPPGDTTPTSPTQPTESGYSGLAAAAGRYWSGRTARHLEATGRAQMISYSTLVESLLVGGAGDLAVTTELGRRTALDAGLNIEYLPTFMLNTISPVPGQEDVAAAAALVDPTGGVTDLRSLASGGMAGVRREWTTRQRTTLVYNYRRYDILQGGESDNRTHGTALGHTWQFSRSTSLQLGYRFAMVRPEQPGGVDLSSHTNSADIGIEVRRPLSPTRQVTFSFGGGATRGRMTVAAGTEGDEYVAPTGYGAARLDIGRTWNVAVDIQRNSTPLEGFDEQQYITDTLALTLGGHLRQRLTMAASGSYSRGRAPAGEAGSFEAIIATVQLDYALGHWGSLVTGYSFYDHSLRGVTGIPVGLPSSFDRNSLRVGITMWVPLYGSLPEERGRTSRN